MKQHITPTQATRLPKKGKEELLEWWCENKRVGDYYLHLHFGESCWDGNELDTSDRIVSPLLSIGQMIEFLDEKGKKFIIAKELGKKGFSDIWKIELENGQGTSGELIDIFWKACKERLK